MNHQTDTSGQSPTAQYKTAKPAIGFWKCWSLTVGMMIGSGVFMLPAVLAPYGSISFLGWLLTSAGAILFALILSRLASRTDRTGGPYAYAHDAFGDLVGFLVAWGYWLGVVFAVTATAVAFAGYAGSIIPVLGANGLTQALVAAALIWTLTAININSIGGAASFQLITTILKLIPLAVIVLLGVFTGSTENIPPFNPQQLPAGSALAATALLTMWAFLGIEACVIPVGDTVDPKRTIPRAVVTGTLSVTVIYIVVTAAVMMLVPVDVLATSTAPFVDAAKALGPIGGYLIAFGALVSTAGSSNANILISGQMPMAAALDGVAPKILADRNKGHAPQFALIVSSVLSTILLVFNYTDGLIAAFTFLISISTLGTVAAYTLSACADLKYSWRSARVWAAAAMIAITYSVIALLGSGVKIMLWGAVLMALGLPIYFWTKRAKASAKVA
ncbi:APC family permease [Hyphococcus sp.]|uniref:APC family permease n=1 Tax=Hyphococcus sp. TaxID=2038636 RepID=UPI00208D4E36|nr:MAG: amino acid permease [Marinicaulis sp.]